MNFLMALIDGIVAFIRRNPLTCLVIFLLAVLAPSVLKGIAIFVLYFILGIVVLMLILMFAFRWRIYRIRRDMEGQMNGQGGFGAGSAEQDSQEGEVKVYKTRGAGEKRVRRDVGDYVDFEEVDDDEKAGQ